MSGQLPTFTHERHIHVANILRHLPYGRELMHLGLQTMAHRNFVPDKYDLAITDRYWDQLDGTLPDPNLFDHLPGGAAGSGDANASMLVHRDARQADSSLRLTGSRPHAPHCKRLAGGGSEPIRLRWIPRLPEPFELTGDLRG